MKTVVITGATSGIGFAAAKALVLQRACVVGVGRTEKNCAAAKDRILHDYPQADVVFFCGDLSSQSEVTRIAVEIGDYLNNRGAKLDVLINNAGGVRNVYTQTADGIEMQFALNHLAGFLMTHRLMPYLEKSGGRVIMTGSESHKHMKINWKDIMYKKRYSCLFAYKQSKLCNMLFANEFNRRFGDRGLRAYVVDPGLVNTDIGRKQTTGLVRRFWTMRQRFGTSADIVAQTYVFLCNEIPVPQGLYYYQCEQRPYSAHADDTGAAKHLFEISEQLCKVSFK